jgi:hypothetical protein
VQAHHPDLADRPHGCRPRPRRKKSDLAEVVAGLHRQHVRVCLVGGPRALDLPGLDDVEALGPIARSDDRLAGLKPRPLQALRDLGEQGLWGMREDRGETGSCVHRRSAALDRELDRDRL